MGTVSEYIQRKLENDIRQKGLLIWLDREGEFSSLVDTWIEQYRAGTFPYPVFAFRGSYLELMMQSRQALSGKDRPKCVIHMPGFNEEEIKATPFYEAYKAGQRWRVSLATMIRESAQGRLPPDRIEALLSREKLDLATAEDYLRAQEASSPELRQLLNRHGEDGLVLRFITDPAVIHGELGMDAAAGFAIVSEHFERFLGLDESWRTDWSTHGAGYSRPREQSDLVASWILCMEYVCDLNVPAPGERLRRLQNKSRGYKAAAVRIAETLRNTAPEVYVSHSEQIEADLSPDETGLKAEDLGKIDTFRFEADIIIREALRLLEAQDWDKTLALSSARVPGGKGIKPSQAFWLIRDRQRQWLWEWIDAAARLGVGIRKIPGSQSSRKSTTLAELTRDYEEYGWELDSLHRHFIVQTERCISGNMSGYATAFVGIRRSLNNHYRVATDNQSRLWNEVCEESGFLGPEAGRQRNFFEQRVKPLLRAKKKTVIMVVDALRFDLGKELAGILEGENSGKLRIDTMLAELPTITAVGMNALVPSAEGAFLSPILDPKRQAILGFKSGQRQVIAAENRRMTLEEYSGLDCGWITLDSLLKDDEKETRKFLAKSLAVVTALDIDTMGESGALAFGIDYFERGLGRIKTAVLVLKNAGFEAIILTTDHGFILGDESLDSTLPGRLPEADRRYALGSPRNGEHLVSASFADLKYSGGTGDLALVFERTTRILNTRASGSFYHGGNSPQERVIPVITITNTRTGSREKGNFRLRMEKLRPVQGYQSVRVRVEPEGEQELFARERLELRMGASEGVELSIGDAPGALVTGDLLQVPIQRSIDISFRLSGRSAKSRIHFEVTNPGDLLYGPESDDYFDAEFRTGTTPDNTEKASLAASRNVRTREEAPGGFSPQIPEEFHPALRHLQKHGSLSENYLVNTLGGNGPGTRKARRFALAIQDWLNVLPFNVKVEKTPEGKEYRID